MVFKLCLSDNDTSMAGDENAQLLLQLEDLKHLEVRSAAVYRDIRNFKEVGFFETIVFSRKITAHL